MNALELYKDGKLDEAIEAATAEVKGKPTDAACRGLLAELLCFAGDLERADKQLDAMGHQDPQMAVTVALFRQLIRAETARREFFQQGRLPEFLGRPSGCLRAHLDASIEIREGNLDAAAEFIKKAESLRPKAACCRGDKPFADFRDLDDTTASFFEVLTSTGKYYWIETACVESIEFKKPAQIRDLLWRQASMAVCGGPDGEVFLPVVYDGSHDDDDGDIRLGRATDWHGDEEQMVRGVGQRMFMLGDQALTILELDRIAFDNPREIETREVKNDDEQA